MAKFCSLFSGSSGNCTYIGSTEGGLLIDIGVSAARAQKALEEHNLDIDKIKGIFVTHAHTDHIGGVRVFAKRFNIPIYMTKDTENTIKASGQFKDVEVNHIDENNIEFDFAKVSHFNTSHDSKGSCGYVVELNDRKLAVCTDLGYISDEVHSAITGSDLVLIESNHDIRMLQNNMDYPYQLKCRIMSNEGHLSNNACAEEVVKLLNSGTKRFVLGHLSRENNMPILARETTRAQLEIIGAKDDYDYKLGVAMPKDNRVVIL